MKKRTPKKTKRKKATRQRNLAKFQIPKGVEIDYKNLSLLQKYLTERGKLIPRRISGITAKEQRRLATAVKRARFLALLTTGGVKRIK